MVHLPAGTDEDELIEQAARRGVGLYGMAGMHQATRPTGPQLVLGFGDTTKQAIEAGIAAIADLLQGPRR